MLMLSVGALTLVLAVAAIMLIGFRRYYRERWIFQGDWETSTPSNQPEVLVTKMKMGAGNHTVSVFESEGKNRVLIEGQASDREKKRLLRYLKSEGFI
jgi:hypothetical protein